MNNTLEVVTQSQSVQIENLLRTHEKFVGITIEDLSGLEGIDTLMFLSTLDTGTSLKMGIDLDTFFTLVGAVSENKELKSSMYNEILDVENTIKQLAPTDKEFIKKNQELNHLGLPFLSRDFTRGIVDYTIIYTYSAELQLQYAVVYQIY